MTLEWLFVACWGIVIWSNYVIIVERTCTSKSINPRPCSEALQYRFCSLYRLLPCYFYIFRLQKPISTIHITLLSPYLHRTSAPIQFAILLGVLGMQEISCIWLQGRLRERPSSSYTSHRLINLRSSTWGKIATILQNSVLGGPTRVYKNKVA